MQRKIQPKLYLTSIRLISWLGLMLLLSQTVGQAVQPELENAYSYLNEIRRQAGMVTFSRQSALQEAAMNHADYLHRNRNKIDLSQANQGHLEKKGFPGYTGRTPGERARHAGYPVIEVLENISSGENTSRASIDGLMSAIYHRFGFLDFGVNEVGIGIHQAEKNEIHVYNMGNSNVTAICRNTPEEALAINPITCNGTKLDPRYMDKLCADPPQEALFTPPYPFRCPNNTTLSADYMDKFCDSPPRATRHSGPGRYYVMCPQNVEINAQWFENFCANPPPEAVYSHSGKYYEICPEKIKVFAEWFDAFCTSPPKEAVYPYSGKYVTLCPEDLKVRVEYLESVENRLFKENPPIVLWPPRGATDVMPVFYEEDPDPLPDYSVSGYPASIQFNPTFTKQVELLSFQLFRYPGQPKGNSSAEANRKEVTNTRLLTQASDPNQQCTKYQFALFPLEPLQENTYYQAVVETRVNGERRKISWNFKTGEVDRRIRISPIHHTGSRSRIPNKASLIR